ncbi:MAG: sialate O-acetylesterase, partial [Opitutaceae bacterium]|nr:sialate O-acetylesterase [Opitutaceae bacterium]
MLAGQSNMQGYGLLTRVYPANPKIMMFGLNNEWMPATAPTHRVYTAAAPVFKNLIMAKNPDLTEEAWKNMSEGEKKKPANTVGPDWSFAESIVAATGHDVGLLPCALGATTMEDWNPANRDQGARSLYGNMIERIKMVGGRVKGVLWYQGEGETGSQATIDGFQTAFLNLVDSIRRDTGIPDLPFIYIQLSRFCVENQDSAAGWEAIREKQRSIVSMRKNLWVVPAIDLPLDDFIHIGASGQERLGKRLAEVALTHVYDVKGHGTPIDFKSCEILPAADVLHNRMRVSFSGVTGWLQAKGRPAGFELRSDDPKKDGPMIYKVEFDPSDPTAVIVWYFKAITSPVKLYYAPGLNPYVNITDSVDMAIPAFGPITVEP